MHCWHIYYCEAISFLKKINLDKYSSQLRKQTLKKMRNKILTNQTTSHWPRETNQRETKQWKKYRGITEYRPFHHRTWMWSPREEGDRREKKDISGRLGFVRERKRREKKDKRLNSKYRVTFLCLLNFLVSHFLILFQLFWLINSLMREK